MLSSVTRCSTLLSCIPVLDWCCPAVVCKHLLVPVTYKKHAWSVASLAKVFVENFIWEGISGSKIKIFLGQIWPEGQDFQAAFSLLYGISRMRMVVSSPPQFFFCSSWGRNSWKLLSLLNLEPYIVWDWQVNSQTNIYLYYYATSFMYHWTNWFILTKKCQQL